MRVRCPVPTAPVLLEREEIFRLSLTIDLIMVDRVLFEYH